MNFLKCNPNVFAINNEYEILLFVKEYGNVCIEINGERYHEENSGVLSSEKDHFKIRIPMSVLDKALTYTVIFKKVLERKKYFSNVLDEVSESFRFKPLKKICEINAYYLADVHKRFEKSIKAAQFFDNDLDILIVNGDIAEVDKEEDFFSVAEFVSDISKGEIPVVFVRGNHDTRGKFAERFTDYFPCNGKNTYFTIDIGNLFIVALDCGEDKMDTAETYAGLNVFSEYRKQQTRFLKNLSIKKDKICFAVSHIPICKTTKNNGDQFDIEKDTYETWCNELERINAKFMISGHLHKAFIVDKNYDSKTCPCQIPVIIGTEINLDNDEYIGTAITINKDEVLVRFTNDRKEIINKFVINLSGGEICAT